MESQVQHRFTQTDHEVHDVFYYKTRAHRAETALLTLRRDQYTHQLQLKLKELEKDTTTKLHLYSYDQDKMTQLHTDFRSHTILTDRLQRKAQEIFEFNIQALNDGHELNDLPMIEDKEIDIETFRLGPVTPTIPSSSRNPHPLLMAPMQRSDAADVTAGYHSSMFGSGAMMVNGGGLVMNGYPPAAAGSYSFPRPIAEVESLTNSIPNFSNSNAGMHPHPQVFTLPPTARQSHSINTHPSAMAPPTPRFGELDIERARSDELLRMLSIEGPTTRQADMFQGNGRPTDQAYTALVTSASMAKPPDVIPRTAVSGRPNPSPSSHASHPAELQISGSMGLDYLDFDYTAAAQKNSRPQKWSQIAAAGSMDMSAEGDWQAVGSKKGRQQQPNSSNSRKAQPPATRVIPSGHFSSGNTGANFEQMVAAVQEKYQLTRPEVIAVLQVVRNERNGDMNISLSELMMYAERLLAKNKSVLKPASLTARARAVPDHAEPCDNQLCPARLKQLKYRTELCLSYQTTGKCHMKPGSCVYAHGESEQRPLPKEELCERYLDGKCNNKRCVYAHGASELKNRPIVNTVEFLKSKHKKPAQESNKPTVSEDLSLTEADHDSRGDECSICLERMSKKSRRKLDCGHDAFHYKCLKKWVAGEGDRSCPLCRSNTLLPEEYPHLGSQS